VNAAALGWRAAIENGFARGLQQGDRVMSSTFADTAVPLAPAGLKNAIDWCGQWFRHDQEISKEFVGIRFAKSIPGERKIAWSYVSHIHYDGMGALALLLKRDGYKSEVALPKLRETCKPGWREGFGAVMRLLLRKSQPSANWRSLDQSWEPPASPMPAGTAVATGALDVERTQRFEEKARRLGVSTNSLLLSALARVTKPYLCEGPVLWRVPVNMRGPVDTVSVLANHSAFVEIPFGQDYSPAEVHRKIKSAFMQREHWATWFFCDIGRIVGDRGMRVIHKIYHAMSSGRPWVGTLSNLGSWNGIGDWYFGPGCQYANPLGAGVITCDGRLLLTLEAHSSIARDSTLPQAIMDQWIAELEA
jgi:hypothetical protein